MIVLTLRTDNPEAEIGLYDERKQLQYEIWEAHRQLAETIHAKIATTLKLADMTLKNLDGIVVYQGPGSFTGLRIGISTTNALANGLAIPIIAQTGSNWIVEGIARLKAGDNNVVAIPEYGAPPHITQQKK